MFMIDRFNDTPEWLRETAIKINDTSPWSYGPGAITKIEIKHV